MKKLAVAFLLLCSISVDAQITHEHSYSSINGYMHLHLVQLSAAGYKYAVANNDSVVLYNLNHSLYLTIQIPQFPPMSSTAQIIWISDELFNTNPTDVEYMVTFLTPPGIAHIKVFDQTGAVLFSRDSFNIQTPSAGYQGTQHTSNGVKMVLYNQFTNAVAVYALPGVLPCTMCDGGVLSGIQPQPSSTENGPQLPTPYPNPTNSTTTIPYTLPAGTSTGAIVVYDVAGREVKRYAVTSAFASLELSVVDLAEGTYSYSLEAGGMILPGKKFVVVK